MEEDNPSIVVVGGFDPRLLLPAWFRAQGLLGEEEAASANLRFALPDVSDWATDTVSLQVTRERLVVQGLVESAGETTRDLVLGVLQLLDQTVTTAIGVNRTMHIDVGGEDNWHKVGHFLAPKDVWRKFMTSKPGLTHLQIEDATRSDGLPGKLRVTVQPSVKYKNAVFFLVNNEIVNADNSPGTDFFKTTIQNHWARLNKESRVLAEHTLNVALAS